MPQFGISSIITRRLNDRNRQSSHRIIRYGLYTRFSSRKTFFARLCQTQGSRLFTVDILSFIGGGDVMPGIDHLVVVIPGYGMRVSAVQMCGQ